jgi:hypothetical protein
MLLEHPSLEPFEPKIGNLMNCAFGDALRGLATAGFRPGDEWHTPAARIFKAACLPGFKKVQDEIATDVLNLEREISALKQEEIAERTKKNPSAANLFKMRRTVLENRELVLRRLVDGILWVLFWPDKWVLRRLRLEGGIRRVDPAVIEQMLKAVAYEHSKGEEDICVICDLSTLAQLGDLILAQWKPARDRMKLIVAELKIGPKNVAIYKRLHNPAKSDLNTEISNISKELGAKAAQQAARMVRQEERLKNFGRVLTTDEGVHPLTGRKFRMTTNAHVSMDYRDKLRELISRAKLNGSSGVTLDGCFHLLAFAVKPGETNESLKVAHEFFHMRAGDFCRLRGPEKSQQEEIVEIVRGPRALNLFDFDMTTSIAMPPLLWYPCDMMLDVLMGRVKVFAQFDHDKFFDLASNSGLKMRFIRGKEAAQIKSANLSGPLPEYRDLRYVRAENAQGDASFFGARFFTKVYTELIRPLDLFEMAKDLVEEAAKLRTKATVKRKEQSASED